MLTRRRDDVGISNGLFRSDFPTSSDDAVLVYMTIIRQACYRAANPEVYMMTVLNWLLQRVCFDFVSTVGHAIVIECLMMLQTTGWDSELRQRLQNCIHSLHDSSWTVDARIEVTEVLAEAAVLCGTRLGNYDVIMRVLRGTTKRETLECRHPVDCYLTMYPDLTGVFVSGLTMSMTARLNNYWSKWVDALAQHGKRIEDVVEAEGNSWLLRDDWEQNWKEPELNHDLLP